MSEIKDKLITIESLAALHNYNKNVYMTDEDVTRIIESHIKDFVILKSSTEGSEKTFKVTVDDTGVLTATEIVEI